MLSYFFVKFFFIVLLCNFQFICKFDIFYFLISFVVTWIWLILYYINIKLVKYTEVSVAKLYYLGQIYFE